MAGDNEFTRRKERIAHARGVCGVFLCDSVCVSACAGSERSFFFFTPLLSGLNTGEFRVTSGYFNAALFMFLTVSFRISSVRLNRRVPS